MRSWYPFWSCRAAGRQIFLGRDSDALLGRQAGYSASISHEVCNLAHESKPSVEAEPAPGRVLTESDTGSSAVTTFTVSPQGTASLVQISTAWDGAGGIGGLFERMFAPRVLRAIFTDELSRLDAYAREHRSA